MSQSDGKEIADVCQKRFFEQAGGKMVDEMIADMAGSFRKGIFSEATTFVFDVDDTTITVTVEPDSYSVVKGKTPEKANCSCKTSGEMFRKIWYDGYKPGVMEFLKGEILCNAPLMLPQFLHAFGK